MDLIIVDVDLSGGLIRMSLLDSKRFWARKTCLVYLLNLLYTVFGGNVESSETTTVFKDNEGS